MSLNSIKSPALILNEEICRRNIRKMCEKASICGVGLNPHFKTHQSDIIGSWFNDFGVERITASSVGMADYFFNADYDDVTIAFPFNIRETEWVNSLDRNKKLTLDVISRKTASYLATHLKRQVHIMIEIDAGYGRTGVNCKDLGTIEAILDVIYNSDHMDFYGFYIHPGHSYDVDSKQKIRDIIAETLACLGTLKQRYISDYPNLKCSMGDTPGCSVVNEFLGIDEIRPGNFVFYDLMQYQLGSCELEDIAVALAAPVVAKDDKRREIVVHGGAVHLSKDGLTRSDGAPDFGWVSLFNDNGWELPDGQTYIRKLSQEHGIVRCSEAFYERANIGELVAILPAHSCLTADCMKRYFTLNGEEIRMMTVF